MALVIPGRTPCAISGRIITDADKAVCFPPFPCDFDDPVYVCSDACVLRGEFEKWKFRDRVVRAVGEFWVQWYHASKAFTVVFENEHFLFVRGEVEPKMRILFLRHAFVIDTPSAEWQEFCAELLSIADMVRLSYSTMTLTFCRIDGKMQVCIDIAGTGGDCIKISSLEWSDFQHILSESIR
jgi:hypothetical protein